MVVIKRVLMIFLFFVPAILLSQQQRTYNIQTVAFYNLENLFDTIDDPLTFDNDRTPKGRYHWTDKLYKEKLQNMALVISKIGKEQTGSAPTILGVAEIENRKVLEDLIREPILIQNKYGIIHEDSPDRRGIDVGLLYQKDRFKPKHFKTYELYLYDEVTQKRVYTRDQLVVSGYLDGDLIHLIVNHWPSRRGGETRSAYKRKKAAKLNKRIIDSIFVLDPYSKIITLGDFNDDPNSPSLKKVLGTTSKRKDTDLKELYNPLAKMKNKGVGTHAWNDGWTIFDQIIVSKELLQKDYSSYRYFKVGIFSEAFLITTTGRYKGYPFRSFSGQNYVGGYSDHLPVYMYLIKEKR